MTAREWRRAMEPVASDDLAAPFLPLGQEPAGGRRAEIRAAAADLTEAGAAEARAVGAQVRAIHRLWAAGLAARTTARVEAMAEMEAAGGAVRPDPCGPFAEPAYQLVVDVAAEVGPALCLPAGTARRRVEEAVVLAEELPQVLAALEAGRIGPAQAGVMVEQWRELVVEAATWTSSQRVPPPVEAVCRLIAELLERAPGSTAAQLRALARARRAVLVADAEERARRYARKNRSVWVEPAPNGMAYLHALLDAPVAVSVHDRLETLAEELGEDVPAPGHPCLALLPQLDRAEDVEERSAAELRADVLADLLLEGVLPEEPGFPRGVRGRVSVMVPVGLLTAERVEGTGAAVTAGGSVAAGGVGCGAAVLSGYGPISTEVARQLAAGAGSWHRLLTHPVTGVVLDHDRTVYTVPADLRRLVELRDATCRFPGCRRRAEACDLDHTVAWAEGGPTSEQNLSALCRRHHRVKHRDGHLGRWTVRRVPTREGPSEAASGTGAGSCAGAREDGGAGAGDGAVLEWTSPGGLVHRTVPEHHHPAPVAPAADPPPFWQDVDPSGAPRPYDPDHDPAPF